MKRDQEFEKVGRRNVKSGRGQDGLHNPDAGRSEGWKGLAGKG